ncbi:MAG: 4Fe-4S binding protein [Eggerthellaceae bacterium]|nr:4Fe-4S binding protein [Eggerthellaceae bacterium]
MKISRIRWVVGALAFVVVAAGIVLNIGGGTFSGFGIADVAVLCPLGALESMLASKTLVPVAVISLAAAVAVTLLVGKAFCSWVCPASFAREFRESRRRKRKGAKGEAEVEVTEVEAGEAVAVTGSDTDAVRLAEAAEAGEIGTEVAELALTTEATRKRKRFDSRHVVLLAALASATVFGFPVFCLVCPIGLLFGTIVLVCQFFGGIGDVSMSLVVFPVVLVLELFVLRSWCSRFCPLGALMSLLSLPNRTLRPQVDTDVCLREQGGSCSQCTTTCLEDLDPHSQDGMNDCSKCGRCVDACPVKAVSFAVLPSKKKQ